MKKVKRIFTNFQGTLSNELTQIQGIGLDFTVKPFPVKKNEKISQIFKFKKDSPSPRERSTFVAFNSKALLFGGIGGKEIFGDIWLFEHKNHQYGEWTRIYESRDIQRFGHTMCAYKNDKFIAFGGRSVNFYLNEVLILDFDEKNEKVKIEKRKIKDLEVPVARHEHASIIIEDEMYVFGGLSKDSLTLNDLWCYNIKENYWRRITTESKSPSPRYGHTLGMIDNSLIVYGGFNSNSDIWIFQMKTKLWKTADFFDQNNNEKQSLVQPRDGHYCFSSVFYRENFLVFGGLISEKKEITTISDVYLCVTNLRSKPIEYKEWIIKKRIGGGSYSDVFQVYKTDQPQSYFAMKVAKDISKDFEIERVDEQLSEVFSQSKMNHPNCLPVLEFFHQNGKLCIIMPLCDFTLINYLDEMKKEFSKLKLKGDKKKIELLEANLLTIIIGILKGLDHIHTNGLLHLDLKPGNILMKKEIRKRLSKEGHSREYFVPKISDFGFSRSVDKISLTTNKGTIGFIAPDSQFNKTSDIYSFGVILYCIFTLNAWHKTHELEKRPLMNEILEDYTWGKTYVKIIEKCCQKDNKERPTAHELLKEFEKKYQLLVGISKSHNFSTPPLSSRNREKSPKSPLSIEAKKIQFQNGHSNSFDTIEYALKSMNLLKYKEHFEKRGIDMSKSFYTIPKERIDDVGVTNIIHKKKIIQFISESQKIIPVDCSFYKFIKDYKLEKYEDVFEKYGLKDLEVLKSLTKEEIDKLNVPNLKEYLDKEEIEITSERFTYICFWLKYIGMSHYLSKFDSNDEIIDLLNLDKNELNQLTKKIFDKAPTGHEKKFLLKLKEQSRLWKKKFEEFEQM